MAKNRDEQRADPVQQVASEQPDEFHGKGGSYVVDPVTGKRTRVEYTIMPHDNSHTDKKG